MSWNTYEAAFHRAFPRGSTVTQTIGGGIDIQLRCKEGCRVTEHFSVRMPPDKARIHLTNNGWRFWGKNTLCPAHNRKKDEPMLDAKSALRGTASDVAIAAANTPVASEEARVAKRMAVMLLEEQFDVGGGRYKNAFSDLKVAKEVGLSEEIVAKVRDELFGPIKEPAEIGEMRDKLAHLAERVVAYEEALGAAQRVQTELLKGIRADLDATTRKLSALAARNGW